MRKHKGSLRAEWILVCVLGVACANAAPNEAEPSESSAPLKMAPSVTPSDAKAWSAELTAPDVARRKAAAQAAPHAGGADAAAQLTKVIESDPSPDVKESAVLSYTQIAQQSGAPYLRQLALTSQDAQVIGAAHASLDLLRKSAPKRGFLRVDFPKAFAPGKAFDIVVHVGSSSDVPRADVKLKLPPPLHGETGNYVRWTGALSAGTTRDLGFSVVSDATRAQSGAKVTVKLQYAEPLDFEVLQEPKRFWVDGSAGAFEDVQPKTHEVTQ